MRDTCIIYNPAAGRGRARKAIEAMRRWAAPHAELRASNCEGHLVELAKQAAEEGFQRIIAAGGDGTVHEVANGILQANKPEAILGVWPIGSSNDYAAALGIRNWFRSQGKAETLRAKPLDVGVVRSGNRERFYVACLGIGFNGMIALESRKIRWLRGMPLYTLAFLRAMLWHYATPKMLLKFDTEEIDKATLVTSINIGIREGGFPITKNAKLDDGLLDWVHVANLSRWGLIRYLPNLMTGNLPLKHAKLRTGTSTKVWLRSEAPLCVHADGEFFCKPDDGIYELNVELLPKRLLVEVGEG